MADATAQLEGLHAAGMVSDEIYEQAMSGLSAAGAGGGADDAELLQHGETATAKVLALPEPADGAGARVALKLEVHPAAGSPYPADCTISAHHPNADLRIGDFLQVKVDPKDPKRVAVDWPSFG